MILKFKPQNSDIWIPIYDLDEYEFDEMVRKNTRQHGALVGYPFYRRGNQGRVLWPIPHIDLIIAEFEA